MRLLDDMKMTTRLALMVGVLVAGLLVLVGVERGQRPLGPPSRASAP